MQSVMQSVPGPHAAREVVLIHPQLVALRDDLMTTGIVYMPVGLAYVAACLRRDGLSVRVIDAFGERPRQVRAMEHFLIFGVPAGEIAQGLAATTAAVFVYANAVTNHVGILEIIRAVRASHPSFPIVVIENTQAVTAYALEPVAQEFYDAGATHILTGGRELDAVRLARVLLGESDIEVIQGVGTPDSAAMPSHTIGDLDALPFPAWDLFPLERYWELGYGHGPVSTARYLALQTSRGCPYLCAFCVVPATNGGKWRGKSPNAVVDEMQHLMERYGVREFHVEDLNPTVSDERIQDICREMIARRLAVQWKIVAGTKVETIKSEATIDLLAKAGCRYISISPETGSPRILKLLQKPLDVEHALRLIRRMSAVGIYSQACFVLGFPGEEDEDRRMTRDLVHRLTRAGVDEIALFIITPVPGSAIFSRFSGYSSLSQLNFSPTWRPDFRELNRFRVSLYMDFLRWKLRHHPGKILRQPLRFLTRRFETKMEMVPYRSLMYRLMALQAGR